MNKNILLLSALLVFATSCHMPKQLSHKTSNAAIDWSTYNTYKFDQIKINNCPAVIGESVVQEIEEGVHRMMDVNGLPLGEPADLLINLTFSFTNPDFIKSSDMNQLMASRKYQLGARDKMRNYYTDGVLQMDIISAKSGELIFTSTVKGFVNADGSEVANGKTLTSSLPSALFKQFPKTGKIGITKQKRIEAKKKEREMKQYF